MISTSPAARIRNYLEQEETVEVPFHNLLTSWGVEEPTSLDRQEMVAELSAAGVRASRPLGELAPDDVVTLSLSAPPPATLPPAWLNESSPNVGLPLAAAVPVTPPSPSPGKRGRWWLRIALAVSGVVLFVAGGCVGGFFYGQGTRLSDVDVGAKLERQAAHDKRVFTERARRSLAQQKRRLTRQRKKAVAAAVKRGQEAGYASGQNAGYASGNSAGYSTGKEQGVEEGLTKGSDELTCSDDLDVPLPPCGL